MLSETGHHSVRRRSYRGLRELQMRAQTCTTLLNHTHPAHTSREYSQRLFAWASPAGDSREANVRLRMVKRDWVCLLYRLRDVLVNQDPARHRSVQANLLHSLDLRDLAVLWILTQVFGHYYNAESARDDGEHGTDQAPRSDEHVHRAEAYTAFVSLAVQHGPFFVAHMLQLDPRAPPHSHTPQDVWADTLMTAAMAEHRAFEAGDPEAAAGWQASIWQTYLRRIEGHADPRRELVHGLFWQRVNGYRVGWSCTCACAGSAAGAANIAATK